MVLYICPRTYLTVCKWCLLWSKTRVMNESAFPLHRLALMICRLRQTEWHSRASAHHCPDISPKSPSSGRRWVCPMLDKSVGYLFSYSTPEKEEEKFGDHVCHFFIRTFQVRRLVKISLRTDGQRKSSGRRARQSTVRWKRRRWAASGLKTHWMNVKMEVWVLLKEGLLLLSEADRHH